MAATANHLLLSSKFSISSFPTQTTTRSTAQIQTIRNRRTSTTIRCNKQLDLLGDFGARDPYPAEIESRFGEKVLSNPDTEHKILIPNATALSLAQQDCSPPPYTVLSNDEARQLLFKVVGWRLADEEGGLQLRCTWKVRDSECGVELIDRINKVVEGTNHSPDLQLEQHSNQVCAVLWSPSIGGLSMNDFIVAAKLDQIKTSDLAPRKRVWA